ncbi:MAG: hypothetical protein KCHDKBKB_00784 [Elusimicrobia bacterium]|nr:hypothetical protein [Elusimicrobiota bacterium]
MLYTPNEATHFWTLDNFGANPSATPGTSVTPGISNAEGSWTEIISDTNLTQDTYGFFLWIHSNAVATPTTGKNFLLDIGTDPAGGTSYSAIISNIVCGSAGPITAAGGHQFFFPIFIKAGTAIAARIQGSHGTATASRVGIKLYGQASRPEMFPTGSFSETIGTITNSNGVSFTPGNAANGSWTSLGTTTNPLWWWNIAYQVDNGTITAEYTYIELAYGDGSNKHIIMERMHQGTTSEQTGSILNGNTNFFECYAPVPAGSTMYIRGRCLNAPDTGYNAVAIGIGG